MDHRTILFKETMPIVIGEALCIPMLTVGFRLLGYSGRAILPGAIAGAFLSVVNFFFMALTASLAADRAQRQNVKGGQTVIHTSWLLRQVVLFTALTACAKFGGMNPIALVIPLVLVRPILIADELIRRKGGTQT